MKKKRDRAAEKAASRAEDERALASGEKTREQLQRENGFFSAIPKDRIKIRYDKARKAV